MSARPGDEPPVVLQLRAEIVASGISFNELGRMAGIDDGRVSWFVRRGRTITLDAATRLCRVLHLELTPVRRKR